MRLCFLDNLWDLCYLSTSRHIAIKLLINAQDFAWNDVGKVTLFCIFLNTFDFCQVSNVAYKYGEQFYLETKPIYKNVSKCSHEFHVHDGDHL